MAEKETDSPMLDSTSSPPEQEDSPPPARVVEGGPSIVPPPPQSSLNSPYPPLHVLLQRIRGAPPAPPLYRGHLYIRKDNTDIVLKTSCPKSLTWIFYLSALRDRQQHFEFDIVEITDGGAPRFETPGRVYFNLEDFNATEFSLEPTASAIRDCVRDRKRVLSLPFAYLEIAYLLGFKLISDEAWISTTLNEIKNRFRIESSNEMLMRAMQWKIHNICQSFSRTLGNTISFLHDIFAHFDCPFDQPKVTMLETQHAALVLLIMRRFNINHQNPYITSVHSTMTGYIKLWTQANIVQAWYSSSTMRIPALLEKRAIHAIWAWS